ncbi:MAG: ribonuclease R [Rhodothermales bacterium]|nr:ribonuclease R [Rhodothermales bacterium]
MSLSREEIRKRILKLLANNGTRFFRPKEITKRIGSLSNEEYRIARAVIEDLKDARLVAVHKGGRLGHRKKSGRKEGWLTVHPKGFGFVSIDDGGPDAFISPGNMGTALDGDKVLIGLAAPRRNDSRREGEVLEILERGRTTAVGSFYRNGQHAFVKPDNQKLVHDIFVDAADFNGATKGQKVVVSIDRFESPHGAPEGRILSILGSADDPAVQVLSIAVDIGVREGFPEEIDREAEETAARMEDDTGFRKDLRHLRVFTIDPEDAKDFDDALHIRTLKDGTFEVGVHIADVSHYVRPGTLVDAEARKRGTSVYLVDRVIPMLPEVLSNNACSLVPNEDRFAFSCILRIDASGDVQSTEVVPSIIHSRRRMSYEQAQEVLDNDAPADELETDLLLAASLARTLNANRVRIGAIDFDMPDVKVKLNPDGTPDAIVLRERKMSNRLIEEFMLLANKAVATLMIDKFENTEFVFRIHDIPNRDQIIKLADYVKAFGVKLEHRQGAVSPTDLQNLLDEFKDRPEAAIIEDATLRAMSKAIYSPDNIGHFGLAEESYTHFTSPIRRYPDLLAHRVLKRVHGYLDGEAEDLGPICRHCSEREKVATNAERESIRLKQVQYLERHLGDEFSGVVSGVTNFGVFVRLDDVFVEGMVHVRDMDGDFYEYDEATYTLRGTQRGKTFKPGDRVHVVVVSTNAETREVDLYFTDPPNKKT